MAGKSIKVGVHHGDGPPPGYEWTVLVIDDAFNEAQKELTLTEYRHMALQVKELAMEQDPTHSQTQSVDAIEDFHELRDTGGVLGNKNARVLLFGQARAEPRRPWVSQQAEQRADAHRRQVQDAAREAKVPKRRL